MNKTIVKALALAVGSFCALYMLLLAWIAAWTSWGIYGVKVMGSLYLGFEASIIGGIIGAIWGFIEGFVTVWVIAYFYSFFIKKVK